MVNLETWARNYDNLESGSSNKDPTSTSQPVGPLQIEEPSLDTVFFPPKGVLPRSTHNPNARVAHNYSIVEDLTQTPCAMSALEVLRCFPMQRRASLSTIRGVDPSYTSLITFDMDQS
jgi:hypothetical protein